MGKLVKVEFKSAPSEMGCTVFEKRFTTSASPRGRLLGNKLHVCVRREVGMEAFDVLQKHGCHSIHMYGNY